VKPVESIVEEFHNKHGFAVNDNLKPCPDLKAYANKLKVISDDLEKHFKESGNLSILRLHLIVEEAGFEVAQALADGNKLELLDALADGAYVVAGTAVAYGLPLSAAFMEVHRSNMTKAVRDARIRNKGPNYTPPNLQRVINDPRMWTPGVVIGPAKENKTYSVIVYAGDGTFTRHWPTVHGVMNDLKEIT